MDNIISYAQKELQTFDQKPFGSVDSLILSCLSYIHFPAGIPELAEQQGVRLAELYRAEYFHEMFHGVLEEEHMQQLFTVLAASPRFRDIVLFGYTEKFDPMLEKQFAAVSFQLNPALCYLAFRGTDSTLVGWKEDFNMAFKTPVPSQEEALSYLTAIAGRWSGRLLLGGHSKGGNLAVYSAIKCNRDIQNRIEQAYSHDGPGFLENVLKSEDYLRIQDRIDKTLPQSSIVGMLLEHQEAFQVVKSNEIGFLQHNPFTWEIENGEFHMLDQLNSDAKYLDQTLNGWIRQLSETERERFVDSLFGILGTNDVTTLAELRTDWSKNVPAAVHAVSQLDDDTREFLSRVLRELARLGVRNFPTMFKNHKNN